jgi:hypothetical protein
LLWLSLSCIPALAACSLLLGEGFTDPDAASGSNDAGTAADTATTTPPPGEGGSDGAPPSGDGGACPAAKVSFCDDFERTASNGLKGEWDLVALNNAGSLAIVAAGPNGNHHLATAVSAKGGRAQLSRTFAQQPAKIHFELSLTLESFASVGAVYVAGIGMRSGNAAPSLVYLVLDTANLFFVQQVADTSSFTNHALPIAIGTKRRIVVDLVFNGKVTVSVDGNTNVDANAQTYLVPNPPEVYLGASSIGDTGDDGAFSIDDFVFTLD